MNRLKRVVAGVFCVMMASGAATAQQTKACAATDADKPAVVETMRAMYDAMKKSDLKGFTAVIAPGFYAYDVGARFDGDALVKSTLGYYKQGYKFVWSVNDPMVEVDCNTAWITYVNKGSITQPDGTKQDATWLDSGVLEKRDGRWLLRFLHSTHARQQ